MCSHPGCRACLTTSYPSTLWRDPHLGAAASRQFIAVVVFPAPLGPSRLSTVPSSTVRSRPSSACTSPRVTCRSWSNPSAKIAFSILARLAPTTDKLPRPHARAGASSARRRCRPENSQRIGSRTSAAWIAVGQCWLPAPLSSSPGAQSPREDVHDTDLEGRGCFAVAGSQRPSALGPRRCLAVHPGRIACAGHAISEAGLDAALMTARTLGRTGSDTDMVD